MIIKLLAKQSVAQNRGVAQFGSARGLGPWGREFESLHPDHVSDFRGPLAQLVRAAGS